ncbi:MAG TPA: glucokinase [Terriglobales bacterium]|jgi:glucokinase|nr:glucokinase [Terriglobales bacterium]HWZ79535.1 glucokinase [Candidatus Sulfotelmatobacter sp.]
MILAGDIGGTNARLAYFQPQNGRFQLVSERVFPSRDHRGLGEIVTQFLDESGTRPEAACFGIAGPVRNGRVETSNLPWVIEQSVLANQIHLAATLLINDLEASAWGIGALGIEDLVTLNPGAGSVAGNQAVVAPGTGLGEAGLFWDGSRHHVFACEGGHTDFAPRGELQIELLRFLATKFGHVSYERILSGPGLVNVYEFLCASGCGKDSAELSAAMKAGDPAAAISQAALTGKDSLAGKALDLWIAVYGAETSNLGLKIMSTGGLFLAGGISPKILPKLKGSLFMEAFLDKGRMRPLVEAMPVHVVTNEKAGLLGAARCAAVRGFRG